MSYNISVLPQFAKDLKKLSKRYKQIKNDLEQLSKILTNDPKSGTLIYNNCYKLRLPNSSIPTGKSSGFRVIYYFVDDSRNIYLMAIYSKSDLGNISDEEIAKILKSNGLA